MLTGISQALRACQRKYARVEAIALHKRNFRCAGPPATHQVEHYKGVVLLIQSLWNENGRIVHAMVTTRRE